MDSSQEVKFDMIFVLRQSLNLCPNLGLRSLQLPLNLIVWIRSSPLGYHHNWNHHLYQQLA